MDFAVSFPEYAAVGPGSKLRVFADTEEILQGLELKLILQRFLDYVHVTQVRAVPKNRIKSYAVYSRYQGDGSVHQKAMRYARRHPETTYEQAVKLLQQKKDKERFPYIQMKSNLDFSSKRNWLTVRVKGNLEPMDLVLEQQFRNFNQNILPVREASKIQALKDR